MNPSIIGEPSYSNFVSDVETYAEDVLPSGKSLSAVTRIYSSAKERCLATIIDGLESDCPVASLNKAYPISGAPQAWHWITITRYYVDSDGKWINFSSLGKIEHVDFDAYYDATSALGGGVVYFDTVG